MLRDFERDKDESRALHRLHVIRLGGREGSLYLWHLQASKATWIFCFDHSHSFSSLSNARKDNARPAVMPDFFLEI